MHTFPHASACSKADISVRFIHAWEQLFYTDDFFGLICLSLVSFHLTGFFSSFAADGVETHSVLFLDLPRSPAKNIPLFWLSLHNCSLKVHTHTKQKTCIHNSWFILAGIFLQWVIFSCHPTLSERKGTWSFILISILSSMCVCESMSKLESRSCNNMPSYSLLMPIGDSVSCVCVFLFCQCQWYMPVIMSFCIVSGLSVHVCLCACALRMLTVHTTQVCVYTVCESFQFAVHFS